MSIRSIRHKALSLLFHDDERRGLPADQVPRLRRILAALDAASGIEEMKAYPGWRLHALKGDLDGFWSLSVSGNWRLIFRFEDGDVFDVDLVDYH
ncbi:MAG: type II toxin-antitoxin system RelE/ParE family toxin [Rhodomicrobium sp.]